MSEAHAALAGPRFLTHPRVARWAALPVLLTGTFMIVLDFFIVNVGLPAMQANLHASETAVEWVLAGYGLTLATLLIFGALHHGYGTAFERSRAEIGGLLAVVALMTRLRPRAR